MAAEFTGMGEFGRHGRFRFAKKTRWRRAHLLECRLISR
jgi:hypothetical protein